MMRTIRGEIAACNTALEITFDYFRKSSTHRVSRSRLSGGVFWESSWATLAYHNDGFGLVVLSEWIRWT